MIILFMKISRIIKKKFILNNNCIMLYIDREFLVKKILNYIIKRNQSIKIRDINDAIVLFSKYVI